MIRSLCDDVCGIVYKIKLPDGNESNIHHDRLKPFIVRREPDKDQSRARRGDRRVAFTPKPDATPLQKLLLSPKVQDMVILKNEDIEIPSETSTQNEDGNHNPYITRYGRTIKPVIKFQA